MARVLLGLTGDSHFSESKRIADNLAVHMAMVAQMKAAGVGAILHGGDLFHAKSSPAERNAAVSYLIAATDVAPVHIVDGNHDFPGDLEIFHFLRTRHRLFVDHRATAPGRASWTELDGGVRLGFIGLPWIHRSHVASHLSAEAGAEAVTNAGVDAVRQLLDLLRAEAARLEAQGIVPLFNCHAQVAGSETSTGQVLVGHGIELSPTDLRDVGCAVANVGHIHKHQQWYDGRVVYPGSPQRNDFGEVEEKGWVLVTLDTEVPGWFVSAEFKPLPARRIVLVESDWTNGFYAEEFGPHEFDGALVRHRYKIRATDLHLIDEDAMAHDLIAAGAHDVKIEAVVVHEARVRSEEIVTALTVAEKIRAFWSAKGIEVAEAQQERVFAKLDALEQPAAPAKEVADAAA